MTLWFSTPAMSSALVGYHLWVWAHQQKRYAGKAAAATSPRAVRAEAYRHGPSRGARLERGWPRRASDRLQPNPSRSKAGGNGHGALHQPRPSPRPVGGTQLYGPWPVGGTMPHQPAPRPWSWSPALLASPTPSTTPLTAKSSPLCPSPRL